VAKILRGHVFIYANIDISSLTQDIVGRISVKGGESVSVKHWRLAVMKYGSDAFAFWNVKRFGCDDLTDIMFPCCL
jgi:hypothetical protein